MLEITLPDGSVRQFPRGTTGGEIAASIGKKLAEDSLAINFNGQELDLYIPLHENGSIQIITGRTEAGLEIIRHDASHMLAEAVKELFPETQVTIGPAIENGFYYDFSRKEPFTTEDLEKIEQRMSEISERAEDVRREEWDRDEAVQFFKSMGEHYKAEIIASIPAGEKISLYRQGKFIDLCRGPHAPSTAKIKHFKLLKVSGAYWRGDHRNEMLQRIYGTAWASDKDLKAYLTQLEEAEKRDHRKIGKELDLFHIEEHSPGMIFWHPNGWTVYRALQSFVRTHLEQNGYVEVHTPTLVDKALWEASGHWEKFRQNMFVVEADEDRTMAVKPMNCPCHVQIFNQGTKSYRDLPLRMAEFGSCHRNESSGSMHGLMRVRGFTQDDAHIFCREDQITSETVAFCELLQKLYKAFGFDEIKVKFSDRPEVRAGNDATWDKAEGALKAAVAEAGMEYTLNPGEGAFYGPKLEFVLRDAIGRDWQCGTLQVDFVLPERLDANYIAEDGAKHRPVMLHRAILGSFERFIGILIENYSGKFPQWLAPIQVAIAPITNDIDDYAHKVESKLRASGLRVVSDLTANKVNYKIREFSNQKIRHILVLGRKEADEGTVSIRTLGEENQKVMKLEEAIQMLGQEAAPPL
jgi:threonyl-tRNA synthetase